MATIQVRVDDNIKERADSLFGSLGLDTSTAVRMFLFMALENKGIPFAIKHTETTMPVKTEAISRAAMFGCLRGQYKVSEDFNAPIEDFKEYME